MTSELLEQANTLHKQVQQLAVEIKSMRKERDALRNLRLNDVQRSALLKLFKDAAAYPMFHFLSLLDGVSDPPQFQDGERVFEGTWDGVTLTLGHDERQSMMLHDAFYDTYPRK